MTIPSIMQAVSQGFNMTQVVNWLIQNHGKLGKKIKSALKQGYTHDQIGEYLTNGKYASHGQRNQMLSGMTEQEKANRIAQGGKGDWKKPLATAAGIGTAALGAYGVARAIPGIATTLGGLFGGNNPPGPTPGPQPMSNAPITIDVPSTSSVSGANPTNAQALPQEAQPQLGTATQVQSNLPQNAAQVQTPQQPPQVDSSAIIREMGLEPKINNLLSAGNSPEQISAAVVSTLTPAQKKWFGTQVQAGKAKDMMGMVKDYLQNPNRPPPVPIQTAQNAPESAIAQQPVSEVQQKPEQPKKISKGDVVATPQGIVGEIESERNGQALIKDDAGKLHKVKADEMIESPISKKDLAELHDDLVSGIEAETGEEASRMTDWAGYEPSKNRLAFLPHNGSLYVYDDISPEDAAQLTNILNTRKTTGENFIGAWKQGSKSPIGAAMSALIKKLQAERGGKGNEYSGKFEKVYDYLEAGKVAARKKYLEGKKKNKAKK